MINSNVEQLESLISAFINNLYKEVPPTEDEFLEKATLLRNTNAPIMPVSDDEFAEIISRLKQSLVIQMDVGVYINDRNWQILVVAQRNLMVILKQYAHVSF